MEARGRAIAAAMDDIRSIEASHGVTRDGVEHIRRRLLDLVAQRELFPLDEFPPPPPGDRAGSRLYRLSQDDDDRFVLYANAARPAVATPPHNHTTWAVVVGFEGTELNRFYRRRRGGVVEQTGEHLVVSGTGVALLPDDVHSIHIDVASLNFHCYGLALERLDRRQYYDAKSRRWRVFPPHLDIREARPGLVL
jgi:predicted metal-dependent enzyme (double-stranded beta helix superfamily)